jgi:outer membrane murein-binding lipoprotein Lpp
VPDIAALASGIEAHHAEANAVAADVKDLKATNDAFEKDIVKLNERVTAFAANGTEAGKPTGNLGAELDLVARFARDGEFDLLGLFWTKQCEKLSLERSPGYAEEAVQCGTDRGGAPPDRSIDVAG